MRTKKLFYRHTLFMLLAVTRFLSRADFNIPTKWYSILDSMRVSTGVLHDRIGMIDEEVQRDFIEVEKQIDRRLGNEKFYSDEEVKELQKKIDEIRL